MKIVLVPVDGGDCTVSAVHKAREMADFSQARLVILNVYDMPAMRTYLDFERSFVESNVLKEMRAHSRKILETARAVIPDFDDYRVKLVSLEGDPATEIINYADENEVDLIVMGSYGMGTLRRLILGSVAHKVLVNANSPVLII